MKKKCMVAVVLVVMTLLFAACSSDQGNYDGDEPNANQETEISDEDSVEEESVEIGDKEKEELEDFFLNFVYYDNYGTGELSYDCEEETADHMLKQLMWNIPCVNYARYPGESQPEELWESGESDPRGWDEDSMGGMVYKYSVSKVNWIATNIFNISQSEIDEAVTMRNSQSLEEQLEDSNPYYMEDGYYYYFTGGIGWEATYDITIDSVDSQGEYFYIKYTNVESPIYEDSDSITKHYNAVMKYKEIDGNRYWSLYKLEEE